MNLLDYINKVFSDNGVISELGGRVLSEQHEYSLSVARALICKNTENENTVSFLQADTGIGKSFGYLIPVMIYLSLEPQDNKRFIVSTYTRQLQKQIVSEDILFIRKILECLGLPSTHTVAYRMGRNAFFSPGRAERVCKNIESVTPNRKKEMNSFLFQIKDICEFGSGLISDYIDEFGELPNGIGIDDICLLQHQKCDNPAFIFHLEKAQTASIVITNHQSLLNPERTKLNENPIEAVIIDEAHKLSSICEDMFNHRLGLNEISHVLSKVSLIKGLNKDATYAISNIQNIKKSLESHPKFQVSDYVSIVNAPEMFNLQREQVVILAQSFSALKSKFNKVCGTDALDLEEAELLSKISDYSNSLSSWVNNSQNEYQISAFGISPIRKMISLATLNIKASMLFGSIIKRITNKTILTSATLANAQKSTSFSQVQLGLGLKSFKTIEALSVSPKQYADMRFVLVDKSIPSPIVGFEDDDVIFNNKWLNNTARMIQCARETMEPLLILTVSHAESKAIASLLPNQSEISLHEKGHAIKEYLEDYKSGKTKVLITSAGWEGLNLRCADNSQLIKNILISRIPFTPPNPLMKYALEIVSKKNPKIATFRTNIEWINSIQDVVAKLKQGLGRGTRAPDDYVTVWFADSRMPHSQNERGNTVLLNAIPDRFLPFYLDAKIFEQKRKELFFL